MVKLNNCKECGKETVNKFYCSHSCAAKDRVKNWKNSDLANYKKRQSTAGEFGGKKTAKIHAKNKTNFFDKLYQGVQGKKSVEVLKRSNFYRKFSKAGNDYQRKHNIGFFDSKQQSKMGKRGGQKTGEILRQNSQYIWKKTKFMSNMEKSCAKIILKEPYEGVNCHIKVGSKIFDFFPNENDSMFINCFVEFHPILKFFRPNETLESYYDDRRKILDNNGFKDKKLIVLTNLEQIT